MGINIGVDIGAISLKLAALGKPEDRAALESVCAENLHQYYYDQSDTNAPRAEKPDF